MVLADVTINILNFNKAEMTAKTVRQVLKSSIGSAKVRVLDNGSTEEDYSLLKSLLAPLSRVQLLRVNPNIGFSGGHNYMISGTKTRYAVMLNNDIKVNGNWLASLKNDLKTNPQMAITGPQVDYANKAKHGNVSTMNILFRHVLKPPKKGPQIFVVEGPCMLIDLKKIPMPFISAYYAYNEDSYLSFYARALGYNVGHCTQANVFHFESITTKSEPRKLFYPYFRERNRFWNVLILYDYFTIFKLLPLICADSFVSLVKALAKHHFSGFKMAGSYIDTFVRLPELMKYHASVQKKRKTPDNVVFSEMYGAVLNGDTSLGKIVNSLVLAYLKLVGIKTAENYL